MTCHLVTITSVADNHKVDKGYGEFGIPVPATGYRITVRFPRGGFQAVVEELPASIRSRFPNAGEKVSLVTVHLNDEPVKVVGLHMPFANPGHPSEGWINRNEPLVVGPGNSRFTLLDVLEHRAFYFVVKSPSGLTEKFLNENVLPPPFDYPYGTQHFWDEERYAKQLIELKGDQFSPAWMFDNDNAHLAALTQSQVQDVMWVDQAAKEIRSIKFPAYFIQAARGNNYFYVILALTKDFRERYDAAWRRLTRDDTLLLSLFEDSKNEEPAANWDAKLVSHPEFVDELRAEHPVAEHELALFVRRPLATEKRRGPDFKAIMFPDRADANKALNEGVQQWNSSSLNFKSQLPDCKRKVEAVCLFHPHAEPFNPAVLKADNLSEAEVSLRMKLHRELLLGAGFSGALRRDLTDQMAEINLAPSSSTMPSLPITNLLAVSSAFVSALMEEMLPADRVPFAKYLTERILGLGIITAAPGHGKTTALAVAVIAMVVSLGKVYVTAPSHVAVDNIAERVDEICSRDTDRFNQGLDADEPTPRARYQLVVRGHKVEKEALAFFNLLKDPQAGDSAGRTSGFKPTAKWKLHLSLAFWLLVLLRSPVVRDLRPDDCEALQKLRDNIDSREDLARLRSVAKQEIDWAEYETGETVDSDKIEALLKAIVQAADIVCTTPALSCQELQPYNSWKIEVARGVAVDEAANMSRPDLYSVWGNTLLPCIMAGDDKQLAPTVLTLKEKDAEGKFRNRQGQDGKISPLLFLKASGWPIFRLRTQLRMGCGLFELTHETVYGGGLITYGPGCAIDLPAHAAGRALERHVTSKYNVTPAPEGTFREVFVHCNGARCFVDQITRSKRSPDQVKAALDFLSEFVSTAKVDPAQLAIISPYKANVELANRLLTKDPRYVALRSMQPAATVDSFQDREADIAVIILGTTKAVGPGFTTDEQRLNVMLSRQKSGLLIFGDINVVGPVGGGKGKGKAKGKGGNKFKVVNEAGEVSWANAAMLHNILVRMSEAGRVIRVDVPGKEKGPAATPSGSGAA